MRDVARFFDELARWTQEHDQGFEDRSYGGHEDQFVRFRSPEGGAPRGVAVLLHGGFWRPAFTLRNTDALAIALAADRWATCNVEYRRNGTGGGWAETGEDVAAACRLLDAVGPPFTGGVRVAFGHSAGGQLALWSAAEGLVDGVVSLAGVTDLARAEKDGLGEDAVRELLAGTPASVPAAYAAADPSARLPLGRPTLLVHGQDDDRVPVSYSRVFEQAARAGGDDCRLLELRGVDHFDVIDPRCHAWPAIAATAATLVS